MAAHPARRKVVQKLLEAACRSAQWGAGGGVSPAERFAGALSANRLEVAVAGAELRVQVTDDAALLISARVSAWNTDVEQELVRSLASDGSPLAELVRMEWMVVRTACRAASHAAGRTVQLRTLHQV
jgi:hypothetical protein